MTDMMASVTPKSNQLNFDDLIGDRRITIEVTKVSGVSGEQPIAINYKGDNGKPYMPCKSMRRILVHCWGADGHKYVGRIIGLYGDPTVKFGGLEVGGIRISHLSHIEQPITIALTASKTNRKPFTVHPLVPDAPTASIDEYIEDILAAPNLDGLQFKYKEAYRIYKDDPRIKELTDAKDTRKIELTTTIQEPKNE